MLQAHEEVVSKCAECAALQAMWGGECSSLQQEVASLGQQVRGASGFRVQELGVRARGPEFKLRVEGLGVLQGRWGDECSSLQQEVTSLGQQVRGASGFGFQEFGVRARGQAQGSGAWSA